MQKMEITIFKLNEDIKFPYQKAEINLGSLSTKVNIAEFIGLVYTDKERNTRKIGVLCKVVGKINQIYLVNNQSYPVTVTRLDVLFRVKILDDTKNTDKSSEYFPGTVELIEDEIIPQEIKQKIEKENLFEKLKSEANKFFVLNRINIELSRTQYNYVKFAFLIPGFLKLSGEEKQIFLEIESLYDRMKFLIEYFSNTNNKILSENNEQIAKRNALPEDPNKTAPFPLPNNASKFGGFGSSSSNRSENLIKEFEEKVAKTNLSEEAKKIALDEIERLKTSKNTPDYEWTVTYLNTLLALPWDMVTVDSDNIERAQEILDRDHFGLEKVKKRIIEYLSVRKLVKASFDDVEAENNSAGNVQGNKDTTKKNQNNPSTLPNKNNSLNTTTDIKSGNILCLNGPPGVGKTSLAKSIADALHKKFYRISLGGLKEVSEISGHRRTFLASMPGMIIQALKRIQSKNPVILLDEIDKVGLNVKGDVASALLEVLDPEQNQAFKDHYLNTPFDLSQVFFICTSNYLENISPPLRDRLEIISISGYSPLEKTQICKKYLLPKQIKLNGLISEAVKVQVNVSESLISDLILNYTYESGVRQLDRSVAAICRKIAKDAVDEMEKGSKELKMDEISNGFFVDKENKGDNAKENFKANKVRFVKEVKVTQKMVEEILGKKRKEVDLELRLASPGVAIGLAYTLNGGSLTLIESSVFNGNGAAILTGNMGDIMKESISTAVSWIKANHNILGLSNIDFSKKDIHIHVPEAAVPKDGPSAGITITISLVSLLIGIPVRRDTAMTGEITLQGYVLPVGGIKEKCFAALRNNIKRIILSVQNKDDVEELPKEIKSEIKFIFVKDIKEVIQSAFHNVIVESGYKAFAFGSLPAAKF